MLTDKEGGALLRVARHALESHFAVAADADTDAPEEVRTPDGIGGVFATLTRTGELRGCIGYVLPNIELRSMTEKAVVAAAESDPRFDGVTADELPDLRISISVLTQAVLVDNVDDIEVGRDGLVIERDGARGLLLPHVATERGWDRDRFLAETCVKAGLPPDSWKDEKTTILRFSAVQFDEYSVNKNDET